MNGKSLYVFLFAFAIVSHRSTGETIVPLLDSNETINIMDISTDGKYAVTGDISDPTAKVWDVATGQMIHALSGHKAPLLDLVFSPDGQFIVTGSEDGTAKIWDRETGKEIQQFKDPLGEPIWSVAYSPNNKQILTGAGKASIWDITLGSLLYSILGHSFWVELAAFSSDGQYALTGSKGQFSRAILTEVSTGENLNYFAYPSDSYRYNISISAIEFTADSQYFIVASGGELTFVDVISGNIYRTIQTTAGSIECIAISPQNKYLLLGTDQGTAELWNWKTVLKIQTFSGHSDQICDVAFSPDTHFAYTGSKDKTIRIWDISQWISDTSSFLYYEKYD